MGWVVAVRHRRRRPEHRRAIAAKRRIRHWLMTSVGDGLSPSCGRQHFDNTLQHDVVEYRLGTASAAPLPRGRQAGEPCYRTVVIGVGVVMTVVLPPWIVFLKTKPFVA